MVSVIIKDNGEKNVIQLTYENLWRELKNIPGSELFVAEDWLESLDIVNNKYVCFVEADCLVSSGYFDSQIGLFTKDSYSDKIAVLSSATAVSQWHNKIYGYTMGLGNNFQGFLPVREMKSRRPYPIEIAYIPGSLIRVKMLKRLLKERIIDDSQKDDLLYLCSFLSLGFWSQSVGKGTAAGSTGCRVHINPNATYVTTEQSVNDICNIDMSTMELVDMFLKESI